MFTKLTTNESKHPYKLHGCTGDIGVLRLRVCFASRDRHCAQDDMGVEDSGRRNPQPRVQPHAAIASSAIRLRITRVVPSSRMNSFFLRSLSRRVTVSRDEPIICAISS